MLTVYVSSLIVYSRFTVGTSHDTKRDLADTLFGVLERGRLEVYWSGVKQ